MEKRNANVSRREKSRDYKRNTSAKIKEKGGRKGRKSSFRFKREIEARKQADSETSDRRGLKHTSGIGFGIHDSICT